MVDPVGVAEVRIWDQQVGAVAWDQERDLGSFEYADSFLSTGLELAPLRMPLRRGIWAFPELDRAAFRGLPGMLADSLPDRWGTEVVNLWLDQQGRPRDSMSPVERLCYVGRRGMGALEYQPSIRGLGRSEEVAVDELADLAAQVLTRREGIEVDLDNEGLATLLQVGTSAGGVRAKAVIAWNPETGETRSGQVDAPDGYEYWLIKFDGVGSSDGTFTDPKGYGRVEYAYHLMAVDAGIEMTPARLQVDSSGRAHFMSKRFDRPDDGSRLHTQTLQAIDHLDYNLPGRHSYEEALRITLHLCGAADVTELYRRMVFNVVARNQDDHTKNIAFLMNRGGVWSLSPAYDVTWAHNPESRWTASHQMTINGKREGIDRSDLLALADQLGVRKSPTIVDRVVEVVSEWDTYASKAGVEDPLYSAVADSVRTSL